MFKAHTFNENSVVLSQAVVGWLPPHVKSSTGYVVRRGGEGERGKLERVLGLSGAGRFLFELLL